MKFTINLATRRYLDQRRINAVLAVVLVVLAGLMVLRVREAAQNQAEISRLKSDNAGAKRSGGRAVSEAQLTAQGAQVAFANGVILRKSTNWLGLLDRLEEVVPEGVAISELRPDLKDPALLSVAGTARTFANLRALLENMEHSKYFSEVYLLNQSETAVGQSQGINFSITCKVLYR